MLFRAVMLVLALMSIASARDTVGTFVQVDSLILPVLKTEKVSIVSETSYLSDTVSVFLDGALLFRFDTRKREVIGDIEEKVLINLMLYILLLMGR